MEKIKKFVIISLLLIFLTGTIMAVQDIVKDKTYTKPKYKDKSIEFYEIELVNESTGEKYNKTKSKQVYSIDYDKYIKEKDKIKTEKAVFVYEVTPEMYNKCMKVNNQSQTKCEDIFRQNIVHNLQTIEKQEERKISEWQDVDLVPELDLNITSQTDLEELVNPTIFEENNIN